MSESINLNDSIIYIKVENAYAVWFNASRNFLMIEEPAFYVLKLLLKNVPTGEIALKFSTKYKTPITEVKKFVSELNQNFQQYLNPTKTKSINVADSGVKQIQNNKYYAEKTYSTRNLIFKINYGDEELEDVIHPLISHLEIDKKSVPDHLFEIYRHSDKLLFKADNDFVEELNYTETGYLKAAVLLKLLGLLHGINNKDWMMTVHAAAVTDGNSAIVFPAMAGSGKSTLATLLHAHEFNLLSDDFLAMDVINKNVYNLPVAATIKEGSFDVLLPHYPNLNDISLERAYTGKQVRYLPIDSPLKPNKGFKAKKFVFVNYSKDIPLTFEKVSRKMALQSLLLETWVNPIPSVVTEFFNWFDKTQFYEMKYSETSDALKIISKLFIQ